jgi:hypothetical protein
MVIQITRNKHRPGKDKDKNNLLHPKPPISITIFFMSSLLFSRNARLPGNPAFNKIKKYDTRNNAKYPYVHEFSFHYKSIA